MTELTELRLRVRAHTAKALERTARASGLETREWADRGFWTTWARPASADPAGLLRGLRACIEMLEGLDTDECTLARENCRPERNAVHMALRRIIVDADAGELEGFCAGVTEILAWADENHDHLRFLRSLVKRHEAAA